jgi:hypothetical protein
LWQQNFVASLPCYLPRQWRHLSVELVCQLLRQQPLAQPLSHQDLSDLQTIAHGLRSPDHALPALQHWMMHASSTWLQLASVDRTLLIRWLWQGWDWSELARETGVSGQKALIQRLRQILQLCAIPPLAPEEMGLMAEKFVTSDGNRFG